MSTRSVTVFRIKESWMDGFYEAARAYRHCDGYPEGHGCEMAIRILDAYLDDRIEPATAVSTILEDMHASGLCIEPQCVQHGDLEYLYAVDIDKVHADSGPVGFLKMGIYVIDFDEDYESALSKEPMFYGSPSQFAWNFLKSDIDVLRYGNSSFCSMLEYPYEDIVDVIEKEVGEDINPTPVVFASKEDESIQRFGYKAKIAESVRVGDGEYAIAEPGDWVLSSGDAFCKFILSEYELNSVFVEVDRA